MASEEEEEEAEDVPEIEPLSPKSFLVVRSDGSADLNYSVGAFIPGGSSPSVPIILIAFISDQFLIAVPFEAWHRLRANRLFPADGLSKPSLVEVPAVKELDREVLETDKKLSVWVGFLKPSLEPCLNFDPAIDTTFACQFVSEEGEEGFVPYAESLVALSDEKFAFLSAISGAEGDGGAPSKRSAKAKAAPEESAMDRIARLEEGMVAIQTSLQQILKQDAPAAKKAEPVKKSKSPRKGQNADGLPGLDPQVVASALATGIDRAQLEEFSKLVAAERPKMQDTPAAKKGAQTRVNILGESEDEAEPVEEANAAVVTDPAAAVQTAIVKLTSIVQSLSSKKKSRGLEDLLDDSLAIGEASSSSSSLTSNRRHAYLLKVLRQALKDSPEEIYKVIEARMLSDFGAPESAPGEPVRSGTFRGCAEHRSKIPNLNPSVRAVWAVTGALDSLRKGKVSEAQARLALYLCQLDQVSVDRGQWILAAEGSLEDPPPFSSFSKHTPPDLLEPQHTRLWPTAWAESFMYKVKELDEFVERRSKLGKRTQSNVNAPANEDQPKKGSGKKGNPKAKAKAAAEEPSSSQT
jgi:hypothetical protein